MLNSVPQPTGSPSAIAMTSTVKPTMTVSVPGVSPVRCEIATSSTDQAPVPRLPRIINASDRPKRANPNWMIRKSRGNVFH
ncbi:MAG: hypothetical protein DYG87_06175 [Anaerolineae bacterium CFX3]|nr:hypothetical protein [Anaerolineae bacterium CFX3]